MTKISNELNELLTRLNKSYADITAYRMECIVVNPDYDHAEESGNIPYRICTLNITGTSLVPGDIDPTIEYDKGYGGGQELDGTILFSDNTWLTRGEYDGSEYWEYHTPPTIESIIGEI